MSLRHRATWLVMMVGMIAYCTPLAFAGSGSLDTWIQAKVKEAGATQAYGAEKAKPAAFSTSSILSHFKEKPATGADSCTAPKLLLDQGGSQIWETLCEAKGAALRERFLLHARPDDIRPMLWVQTGLTASATADFEAAKKLVIENVLHGDTAQCEISASRAPIVAAKDEILCAKDEVTAPWERCWLFFIDDAPLANFGHDCRYVFVSPSLDTIVIQYARMPLRLIDRSANEESVRPFDVIVAYAFPKEPAPAVESQPGLEGGENLSFSNDVSHCYAIVISGGADKSNNHIRYWNDASFIYSTLTKKYGYTKDHIYALISDGTNPAVDRSNGTNSPTDLDGDGAVDTDYAATLANVQTVFNQLASILTAQDQLFFFSTDHGNQVSGWSTNINLWNWEQLTDANLKTMTKNLPCPVMFAMEQCFSGGFLDDLNQNNRCIATAAIYYRSSFSGNLYPNYNDWCYFWTAAVRGHKPGAQPWLDGTAVNADTNGDGRVSFKEAYDYAYLNRYVGTGDNYDTPQYQSNPTDLGNTMFLDKNAGTWTPDLVAGDVYPGDSNNAEISSIAEGQSIRLCLYWSINDANVSQTFRQQLWLDGSPIGYSDWSGNAGTHWITSVSWTATPGWHTLTGMVDSLSQISESNESNNVREEASCFYVSPPPYCVTASVDSNDLSASGDSFRIWASIPRPITSPCYVFFRIVSPYYGTYYMTSKGKLLPYPAPYVPYPLIVSTPISNYYIGGLQLWGLKPGTYYLETGAVDAYNPVTLSGINYLSDVCCIPLYFR